MSSSSAIPYIGSKISLVTNSELRYEGILININTTNSTVTLRDVRMSGTENRKAPQFVMPSSEVFDYIIFNGKDIKDLTVSEPAFSVKEDPAVVAVNVAPPQHYEPPRPEYDVYGRQPEPVYARGFSPVTNRRGGGGMYGRDYYGPPGGFAGGYARPFARGGRVNMGATNNSRNVVGELTAQPNSNLKTQVAQAFDFEQNNSKFEKEKIESSIQPYDKETSFFDNISCETLNRQHGRDSKVDREKQRELDAETFGPAATLTRGPRYYRRGYRRPAGGVRGRGGYGGMYGGGGYYGNPNGFPLGGPNQMLRAQ